MIDTYKAEYDQEWPGYFKPLDEGIKLRVARKVGKILNYPIKRHLKKSLFFVDEVGQYRIVYRILEDNIVRFYFVGTHKEYEKWYRQGF
ncbi:MAG: hypothetical protein KGH61_04490 [Candidatus Micrarchaeota archaeon]|nr:hypothetical protein [Candidatus Micrarchaeota archaeon]MDE1848176.1 hypothetical protein [Candidatus Micrarchaeota archaeon]MDE1864657.1 hypothetical protein [Candidatus Micrarchaeota archaeon]